MCGIVGILGREPVAGLLVDALKRLEYRGYDSAGVATLESGQLVRRRAEGKLRNLEARLAREPLTGTIGIGHTRWATHGRPTEGNAHPHATEHLAVVHNGIIENFRELREELEKTGAKFGSETDTEVVAHLVTREMKNGRSPADAVAAAVPRLRGAFEAAASAWAPWTAAFVQRLHELGWIEGRTIAIQYRWAEGRAERWAEIAAEFVRLKVDVIVGGGNAALAAKQASTIVPIVFTMVDDPVGMGLVASLARPGGNITGLAINQPDLAGKRLALLREVVPGVHRVGIMANVEYPFAVLEMGEFKTAARTLGLEVVRLEIRRAEDIAPAFEALKGRAEALYVVGDALVTTHRMRINTLALAARVPTMHVVREFVEVGGLMSYGPNFPDLFRRAADHVDRILRGTKPGEIPVEQPSKFDLVINLTTAKALGLTIHESFLLRADEVIE